MRAKECDSASYFTILTKKYTKNSKSLKGKINNQIPNKLIMLK